MNDRTIIGNPNPDFVYGFNFNISYKRLSANILFNGVYGNDIANGNLLQLNNAEGLSYLNISPDAYYSAWRPDAQTNIYPRIGYSTNGQPAMTDRIIEDGSYLRLSNLTIGYDFDVNNITWLSNLKMFIAGQNLITWTDYSGYDPEISSFLYNGLINGVDWNGRANAKTFILGLNGAPQAGDTLKAMKDEKEAKKIAAQRSQIQREQQIPLMNPQAERRCWDRIPKV